MTIILERCQTRCGAGFLAPPVPWHRLNTGIDGKLKQTKTLNALFPVYYILSHPVILSFDGG